MRTSPSPITNNVAMSTTIGSLKPASASGTLVMPHNGRTTITRRATTSMRGLLATNNPTQVSSSRRRRTASKHAKLSALDREATFAGAPRAASTAMHQVVLAFGRFSGFDKFANVSFRTTRSNVYGFSAEYGADVFVFRNVSDFADLTQSAKSLTAPEPVLSDFTISHLNRT